MKMISYSAIASSLVWAIEAPTVIDVFVATCNDAASQLRPKTHCYELACVLAIKTTEIISRDAPRHSPLVWPTRYQQKEYVKPKTSILAPSAN